MRSPVKLLLALLAVAAGGCVIPVSYAPQVLVIPVSFEAHLLAARQCEFVGTVSDPRQADSLGANVVLAFVYDVEAGSQSTHTEVRGRHGARHGGSSYGAYQYARLTGKAMSCPEPIVAELAGQAYEMQAEVSP